MHKTGAGLALALVVGLAGCGGQEDAAVSSPLSPYTPEVIEPAVPAQDLTPEQLIVEQPAFRRWTCEADPSGLQVTFHGPAQAAGRAAWQGPGHRRYNVDPIYVPAQGFLPVGHEETVDLETPKGACGGSYQVDWKTKSGDDGCWDFVDLPPCTEPTPPPCRTEGLVIVYADTKQSGEYLYEARVDGDVVWTDTLGQGEVASFVYDPDGKVIELWLLTAQEGWEHDQSVQASCQELRQEWNERLSYSCHQVCNQ